MTTDFSHSQQYLPVELQSLKTGIREIEFDIFVKLSDENYVQLFSKSLGIDYRRLFKYESRGVREFHVRAEEFESYLRFASFTASQLLVSASVSREKKIASLISLTEQCLVQVFSLSVFDEKVIAEIKTLVNHFIAFVEVDPGALVILLKLISQGGYLYYHSVSVMVFSLFLARRTQLFSRQAVQQVAIGALLHDFGKTAPIDAVDLEHPVRGVEKLGNLIDEKSVIRKIIIEHHEQPSGKGYPYGLRGSEISVEAKLVSVANVFNSLISERPHRKAISTGAAIDFIVGQPEVFDSNSAQVLSLVFASSTKTPARRRRS